MKKQSKSATPSATKRLATIIIMAIVKFGGGLSDMRGSIAGTTFSRNSAGAIARQKVTPVNPNTVKQSAIRATFSTIAAAWRTLTDAVRSQFNLYAPDYVHYNVFGDNMPLTGQQLFQKLSMWRNSVNLAPASSCNPPVDVPSPTAARITFDTAGPIAEIENLGATSATERIAIYATAPYSSGIRFVSSNKYKLLGYKTNTTAAGDFDLAAAYAAYFGTAIAALPVGSKIAVRMVRVNTLCGQPSAAYELQTTIV